MSDADTATSTATMGAAPETAAPAKPGMVQQLRANPIVPLIFGVALAATLVAAMLFWASDPSYGTLYSGLSDADGGEIIAQLEQMQVPYKLTANGSAILVPTSVVDSTRLTLASQGLPQSAGVGFEIMDKQAFGISQFAEHINYMRALQGELARSIETLDAVASARVHLAVPEPTVFVRKQALPSASVVLQLYRGRSLTEAQVSAIMHLVASSVTHLPVDNVTVVDAAGHLLSKPGSRNGVDGSRLEYTAQIERDYRQRIEAILAPVVGRDNVRARVVADIDFSVGERTEEGYTPNAGEAAVRSKQINASRQGDSAVIGGVPGALSNRPAADLPSPINDPEAQQAQKSAAGSGKAPNGTGLRMAGQFGLGSDAMGGDTGSASRSATVNYELDRVIRHIQKETGTVEHVSAAVVVNYRMHPDASGELQPVPLADERMQQIEALVKRAIGFSASRGDSVAVVNVPFQQPPAPAVVDGPPWWRSPQVIALAKSILQWLLVGIVVLLLWRKLVKPLVNRVPQLAGAPQLAAAGGNPALLTGDEEADGSTDAADRQRRRNQQAALMGSTRELARDDPKLVAMILRSWMSGNG